MASVSEAKQDILLRQLMASPGSPARNPTPSKWQDPPCRELLNIRSSELPLQRDIVIIGSGVTGCSAAWWLLKDGQERLTVSVLEAREICSGATGRNGGRVHCTAVQDYDTYSKLFGEEAAKDIVRFELAHLPEYQALAKEAGPDATKLSELREVTAVLGVFEEAALEDLRRMLRNFNQAFPDLQGLYEVIGSAELRQKYGPSQAIGGLVYKVGAVWPYRLFTTVYQTLLARHGARFNLEANTPIEAVRRSKSGLGYCVTTPRGCIFAKHVLYCTEAHTAHLLPKTRGLLIPRRGQMTVQKLENSSAFAGGDVCWSFLLNGVFDYATQNRRTGEIWIGGGDLRAIETADDYIGVASDAQDSVVAQAHLGGVLQAVFDVDKLGTGVSQVNAAWSGIMCFSLDHAPLVGSLPANSLAGRRPGDASSNEWIAAGYGGYGMMVLGSQPPSWLPKQYLLTEQRMEKLTQMLQKIQKGGISDIRALL
ncbi:hypothetical protein H2204_000179 [Knufia peltigerae]|uniref:FAD dependent oxidoreductase domain-containing protein n=1 Tax=Knufia peltigerae TaxID=1002370 RepID=A0AA38YFR4_9EURO|nr:hypothetical protein H2204_000179 [Knufia peltigerae]